MYRILELLSEYHNKNIFGHGWTVAIITLIFLVIFLNILFFTRTCCQCCQRKSCRCCQRNTDKQSIYDKQSNGGYNAIIWNNSEDENDCSDDSQLFEKNDQFIINDDHQNQNQNENENQNQNEIEQSLQDVVVI